ncbi:MAG: hypothetical protein PVF83_03990 [Anaerolineales bacterium]
MLPHPHRRDRTRSLEIPERTRPEKIKGEDDIWKKYLNTDPIPWLLEQETPWVRYRTLVDLLDRDENDPEVSKARKELLTHPKVVELIEGADEWPGYALTRHNDANHPIHKLTVLADFGLNKDDPGIADIANKLLAHQSEEGAFQTLVRIPKVFGGTDEDSLSWMLCDTPTILHALIQFGYGENPAVQKAQIHLVGLIRENGWPCAADSTLGKFRGPGRKDDPCPYANLIAAKVLLADKEKENNEAVNIGAEMLLKHWKNQRDRKIYMFGIGTTYRRLKYPFIWYDILHVLDVLSRLPTVHSDPRLIEMTKILIASQDEDGRFKAGSVWKAWRDWSFGQKREPSPWITFLALRILKRVYP